MLRDRRTIISMMVVPLGVFPLLILVVTHLVSNLEERSQSEARSMGIATRVSTPALREALERTGFRIFEETDLKFAVENKKAAAGVEEISGTPPKIRTYVDSSNPASSEAGDKIRAALTELRDREIRQNLRASGISEAVLAPFIIERTNIAGQRKMAGAIWGTMLGYILLLLMFTGGMYPVIDMTAGEKERKTLEAFLASPASRGEIVIGKTLAAMTAIFVTAALTLGSMVYSLRGAKLSTARSPELQNVLGTVPLDAHNIALIALTLIPMAIFAASLMFAIALFARSFKEGQSYLTPLALVVIFPALLGGLPGLELTPALCLVPIFNASMVIRGILRGDLTMANFAIALAANLFYAGLAFWIASRQFEKESVLFRS